MPTDNFLTSNEPFFSTSDAHTADDLINSARAEGFAVVEFNAENLLTKENIFAEFEKRLSFPGYFGHNWDAMDECLADLPDWLEAKGYLLVIRNASLLNSRPDLNKMLRDVLATASKRLEAYPEPKAFKTILL